MLFEMESRGWVVINQQKIHDKTEELVGILLARVAQLETL